MSENLVYLPGLRGILFDLDGTLLDSVPAILEGSRIVYAKMGIHFDESEVRRLIGIPLKEQSDIIAGPRAPEFLEVYRTTYRSLPEADLFPGAQTALECLSENNFRLAVVTSKVRKSAMRTLEEKNIAKYFECVITADDVSEPKPDPEPALKAIDQMRLRPEEAVFVGDSIYDIECGHAAGIAVAAVNWGAGNPRELAQRQPEWQFSSWIEFTESLCKMGVTSNQG